MGKQNNDVPGTSGLGVCMTDPLADLLALADDDTHGPWMTAERKVIAALVRVAQLAEWLREQSSCEDYHHNPSEYHVGNDCPVEKRIDERLRALDAALNHGA